MLQGLPAGVFNLVNGDGPGVGTALTNHDLVDMVSFTGSTCAGRLIGAAAAQSIKRVALRIGREICQYRFCRCGH